jgi:hypothetical protein
MRPRVRKGACSARRWPSAADSPKGTSMRGASITVRLLLVLLVMLAAMMSPATVFAQAPAVPANAAQLLPRQAIYTWEKQKTGPDLLMASFSFVDIADNAIRDKLKSGLPSVVTMRAYVLREGDSEPVALAARTCRVAYDLWDEVFRVTISGPGGDRNTAALEKGVLRQCFEANNVKLADRTQLIAGKSYFLGVIVEVNPVNAQMVDQMKKWVSRPAGSTGIGPGDALFGSFVGLFVRQIGTADRTLLFRTQSVTP